MHACTLIDPYWVNSNSVTVYNHAITVKTFSSACLRPDSEYDASRRRVVDVTQEPQRYIRFLSLRCVASSTRSPLVSYSEPGLSHDKVAIGDCGTKDERLRMLHVV